MASHLDAQWVTRTRKFLREAGIPQMLTKHLNGEIELTQSQVNVAVQLLDRILPKLSHQSHEHKHKVVDARELSFDQLASEIYQRQHQPEQPKLTVQ